MSQNHRIALTIEAQSKGEDKLKSMTDALEGKRQALSTAGEAARQLGVDTGNLSQAQKDVDATGSLALVWMAKTTARRTHHGPADSVWAVPRKLPQPSA